jgi:alpha-methylacyl-CoA racemase
MTDQTPTANASRAGAGGPLGGLRIVEFAGIGPGPFAAMLLADMGADVVRIDRPGAPERDKRDVIGRGRRALVLDLKQHDGVETAWQLLDAADALIEGFRPGVMERLGLGPDVVLARNPRLVYGRVTGWGQSGPLAQAAGHDINYIALAGALGAIGPEEKPVPPLNLVGDYGGGALYLVAGMLAAVIEAKRSGYGQVVDCAMCDGAASLLSIFFTLLARGQWQERRGSNLLDGGAPFYGTYECADGKFVAVGALEPQFYETLCRLAGLEAPEFRERADRKRWPELRQKMQAVFKTRTRADWCAILEGSDACFAPVLGLTEASTHPHMAHRNSFVEVDGVLQPAPAPRFSRTPSAIQASSTSAPAEILARWRARRPVD